MVLIQFVESILTYQGLSDIISNQVADNSVNE